MEEIRGSSGVVRFAGEVKVWPPSVDAARPARCYKCGRSAYDGSRVRLHGNGLVSRQGRGPSAPDAEATGRNLLCRTYECQECGAVMRVVPPDFTSRKHFTGAAIAMAFALWGLCGKTAAEVRGRVNDWKHTGPSARGWASLERWARQAARGGLFGWLALRATGPPQVVARDAAQALCGWAPPDRRPDPLDHQAFAGACHVS